MYSIVLAVLSLWFARSRTGIQNASWPSTRPTQLQRSEIVTSSTSPSSRLPRSSTWPWRPLLKRSRFTTRWTSVESVSSWLHFLPSSSGGTPYDSSDEPVVSVIPCRVCDAFSDFDMHFSRIGCPQLSFITRLLAYRTVGSTSALLDSDRVAVSRMGYLCPCLWVKSRFSP